MKTPLDEFCEKLESLAGGSPSADFRRNARALASSLLSRMNVVSREEFDAQSELLSRAAERLSTLEEEVRKLRESANSG